MKKAVFVAGSLLFALGSAHAVDIKYALWHANQRPAYQQCPADFEKKNPSIKIKISQMGWNDYWTAITTGFVSGDSFIFITRSQWTDFGQSGAPTSETPDGAVIGRIALN